MHLVARTRHELARRPWLRWAVVTALVGATVVALESQARGVADAKAAWGETARVLVADVPVRRGDALATAVTASELPVALVPPSALATVPVGAIARQDLAPGEIVTELDVTAGAGPLALVPDGWVAVPVGIASSVHTGDRVAVASGGSELAPDALVVSAGPDGVLVAVPRELGALVAAAAVSPDGVVLLLVP